MKRRRRRVLSGNVCFGHSRQADLDKGMLQRQELVMVDFVHCAEV